MTHAEIAAMPLAEKLQLMELLWVELQHSAPETEIVPDWHLSEVAHRMRALEDGAEELVSMQEASSRLRGLLVHR
jgi:hypothetical protein